MTEFRTLLVTPCLHLPGGIAGYYQSLSLYLPDNFLIFEVGARRVGEGKLRKPINVVRDFMRLGVKLWHRPDFSKVVFNPSLIPSCTIREGLFLCLAKALNRDCVVFFRGWDNDFADFIQKYFFKLFFAVFNRADMFIVLSHEFGNKLRQWGFEQPIVIETTTVDDSLVSGFLLQSRARRSSIRRSEFKLLFLSRLEEGKGLIEAIDAISLLIEKYPGISLAVAGVGGLAEAAEQHVSSLELGQAVDFLGWVSGNAKKKLLEESDLLILPSSREGMPNCVLEAMALGLPVLITPVGGINDFFVDGRFGFLLNSKTPSSIASLVDKIISDDDLYINMSNAAFNYAQDNFLASIVSKRFVDVCDKI